MSVLRSLLFTASTIMRDIAKYSTHQNPMSYQEAVETLNTLQSNATYLKNAPKYDSPTNPNLDETKKYLQRCGISVDDLNGLSVVHIAGSKGKGSTCAYVEAILRAHGYRTGLYTSPHLVSVRERMRINGEPISEALFTQNFHKVYESLYQLRKYEDDMPPYFKFLTIMMFHMFLNAAIDVAIIEVGIGGEYDCTNVVPRPICVGISKLDFDHMHLLGDTLAQIAWQKSGIFKENVPAFVMPQEPDALAVLQRRAEEKRCTLTIVPSITSYPFGTNPPTLGIASDIQYHNASLAIELANSWAQRARANGPKKSKSSFALDIEKLEAALASCKWPGRSQILRGKSIDFYLDGAHTITSMQGCIEWFKSQTSGSESQKRVLLFNMMGKRDSKMFLDLLRSLDFVAAFFTPNLSGKNSADQDNKTVTMIEQMNRCRSNCEYWGQTGTCVSTVSHALELIEAKYTSEISNSKIHLLVTGSLHLVGAALAILDENLTMSTNF